MRQEKNIFTWTEHIRRWLKEWLVRVALTPQLVGPLRFDFPSERQLVGRPVMHQRLKQGEAVRDEELELLLVGQLQEQRR